MPEDVAKRIASDFWMLIPTIVYFFVGLAAFGFSIWLIEKITPFSVRKEIEDDQNTALGIIMGSALIALSILLAAAIIAD